MQNTPKNRSVSCNLLAGEDKYRVSKYVRDIVNILLYVICGWSLDTVTPPDPNTVKQQNIISATLKQIYI